MTPESSAYDASLGYHPSAVPLDISLGLTSPPSRVGGAGGDSPRPLRWGVLATGKAAHDFVQALIPLLRRPAALRRGGWVALPRKGRGVRGAARE